MKEKPRDFSSLIKPLVWGLGVRGPHTKSSRGLELLRFFELAYSPIIYKLLYGLSLIRTLTTHSKNRTRAGGA